MNKAKRLWNMIKNLVDAETVPGGAGEHEARFQRAILQHCVNAAQNSSWRQAKEDMASINIYILRWGWRARPVRPVVDTEAFAIRQCWAANGHARCPSCKASGAKMPGRPQAGDPVSMENLEIVAIGLDEVDFMPCGCPWAHACFELWVREKGFGLGTKQKIPDHLRAVFFNSFFNSLPSPLDEDEAPSQGMFGD